jgi:hypothetical protein
VNGFVSYQPETNGFLNPRTGRVDGSFAWSKHLFRSRASAKAACVAYATEEEPLEVRAVMVTVKVLGGAQ